MFTLELPVLIWEIRILALKIRAIRLEMILLMMMFQQRVMVRNVGHLAL